MVKSIYKVLWEEKKRGNTRNDKCRIFKGRIEDKWI